VKNKRSGAEILVESLVAQGVERVFGYPGGAVLPIYDALFGRTSASATFWCATKQAAVACGRRLCALHRQARRGARDLRPRRDQRGHRASPTRSMNSIPLVVHHRPGADRT